MTAFELQFRPSATLIQVVRRFVFDFYEGVLDDPDTVARVALATHELLENAVKYSLDGATELSLGIEELEGGTREVALRLRNRAAASDVEALTALFAEMDQ